MAEEQGNKSPRRLVSEEAQQTRSTLDTKGKVVLKLSTFWIFAKKDNLGQDTFVTKIKGISSFPGSLPEEGQPEVIRTVPTVRRESHRTALKGCVTGPGDGPISNCTERVRGA